MSEVNYDIHSEEELKKHCANTEAVADQYKQACIDFGDAKLSLDRKVWLAIKEGKVKESMAYEKMLPIIAELDQDSKADYEIYVKSEMLIKGLEKVLSSREKSITLHQSLMKNRQSKQV